MKGPVPTEMPTTNRSTLGQISSTTLVRDLFGGQNKGASLHHCRAPNQTTLCVTQQVVQAACARYEHQSAMSVRTMCFRSGERRMSCKATLQCSTQNPGRHSVGSPGMPMNSGCAVVIPPHRATKSTGEGKSGSQR
jgi:hypothetical protein